MPAAFTVEGTNQFTIQAASWRRASVINRGAMFDSILNQSMEARRQIKIRMPVDFGDARGRWGTPGYTMANPDHRGRSGAGIWVANRTRLEVKQGAAFTPFEYIEVLNAGSSRQAPAGFLDAEGERTATRIMADFSEFRWFT